jgi:hypothetical protein
MTQAQKTAYILGLSGLIPFIIPAIVIWFVTSDVSQILETMQMAYAALIISFMGGVQWGYAVKQGDAAQPVHYILSVIPTLIIFGTLFLALMMQPYHLNIIFIILLVAQNIMDQARYVETWFLKLRWVLTVTASLSLLSVGIFQFIRF